MHVQWGFRGEEELVCLEIHTHVSVNGDPDRLARKQIHLENELSHSIHFQSSIFIEGHLTISHHLRL